MTQDDLLVSIIVPVYNSREYLRSCIDSVLRQDYSNIEVIIVDDGSDDGSETMCDEYMAQDARIRVIHQPNAGHVQARRTGLRHAQGDAVMWIDSDDWVAADWVSSYVDLMEQSDADIVISGTTDAILRAPADMVAFLLARADHTLWASCVRRDLYSGLDFADVTIGEDVLMLQQLISRAGRMCLTQGNHGYHYREVPDSISRQPSLGNKKDWLVRAQLEVEFTQRHNAGLVTCAYFDVMRGATLVYKSVCRLTLERDEHAQADELKRDLRALMKRGMLHAPLRHMRAAEYITVLKTMKTYLLER